MSDASALATDVRELECDIGLAVVVRLDGTLTVETAPIAREALLKAVASQPAVVVVDLAALTVPNDVVLALFPSVARQAAAWPGILLVLAQPSRHLAAALDRTAVLRYVPVVASVAQAWGSVDRTPPRRFAHHGLAGPGSVAAARAMARDACLHWQVPALADVAELIASELTSNAVRHAGGGIEVVVAQRQRDVHLSVRDRSSAPPRLGRGDGRGLILVEALSVAWGSTTLSDGKVVWATLRLP
jgi:anti-anti-sigma regulatory factor